jgi:diadenosine tetraphosphate (Ap4A) HIT family hydrolase
MADAAGCEICRRISRFTPDHPFVIAEMQTGWAVIGDQQVYRGYTLFLAKRCVPELHLLPRDERSLFLDEMAMVAEAAFRAFSPRKLNYELLGNSVAHLHWHLFPRYADDPNPTWPVWSDPRLQPDAGTPHPERPLIDELREAVRRELAALR